VGPHKKFKRLKISHQCLNNQVVHPVVMREERKREREIRKRTRSEMIISHALII
jgi:hypothetical protein